MAAVAATHAYALALVSAIGRLEFDYRSRREPEGARNRVVPDVRGTGNIKRDVFYLKPTSGTPLKFAYSTYIYIYAYTA